MAMILDSLGAVFLVIAAGWALRACAIPDPGHWAGIERLTYQVLFPAVVVHTLAFTRLGDLPFVTVGLALVGAILAVAGLLLALRPTLVRAGIDGPAFTSVFQGAVRWNTFVALALAAGLHGREGTTLMAVAVAAMIPLLNIMSVFVLARHGSAGGLTPGALARTILTNPFIWSSALGFALNPIADFVPRPLALSTDILNRAALGLGLLVVGAGLDLRRTVRLRPAHGLAILLKLVLLPVIAWGIAHGLGVSGTALGVTVIAGAVPTATGSYFLARQLGGDAPLMAEITTVQTFAAALTLPTLLYLLM